MWSWAVDFQDSGKKRRKYHQSCILPVQSNILLRKYFGEKEFNTCGFLGKNLRISAGKCLEEISEGTNSAKKGISNHLLSLGEKFSNFSPKVPSRAVITAFYVSKEWILGKKVWKYTVLCFSRTPRKPFWTLYDDFFGRIIIYAFYSPKGSFWEKFLFEICAAHSRISSDNKWGFIAENFSVGLSNLNPKCPDHPLSEKKLVAIFISFVIFGLWAGTSQKFDKKIVTGLPKLPSTVSEIFKGEKLSHQKKIFLISFWLWANDFRASAQKFRKVN